MFIDCETQCFTDSNDPLRGKVYGNQDKIPTVYWKLQRSLCIFLRKGKRQNNQDILKRTNFNMYY